MWRWIIYIKNKFRYFGYKIRFLRKATERHGFLKITACDDYY